jgi:hypothetical protein
MTLFKPTLSVDRLVVLKEQRHVIDLIFHPGLNIIRGENSAGKTTVIRFLAHALGSENIRFNQSALLCTECLLGIRANGIPVTLRRSVSDTQQQPISIFWGTLEQALNASLSEWQTFPFRRSESKESFSQVFFRLLGMPELRGQAGSNITTHQLIRLIYSDQETVSGELFRTERFDAAITREAIGNYLLGIDANELYELRLQETSLEKQLSEISSGIRSIFSAFGASGTNISVEFLRERLNTLASELTEFKNQLTRAEQSDDKGPDAETQDRELRNALDEVHRKLSTLRGHRIELESEITDSTLFLEEIEERLYSLNESMAAEAHLGTAVFSFCPSCFAELDRLAQPEELCALCKSPRSVDSVKSQFARMLNELSLQQRESKKIRERQLAEIERIDLTEPSVLAEYRSLEDRYKRSTNKWRSSREIETQRLSREIGSKEQEIKNTAELMKLADLLDGRQIKSGELQGQLEWVRGRIEAVEREQQSRRNIAYLAVADRLTQLLKGDLDRQTEFSNADEISIDFGANKILVNGQPHFSASSMIYLRHSFHFALLLASTDQSFFRFPRLVILDGIEDGGMEQARSFNFQRLIQAKSDETEISHQIIIATSQIAPDLDSPQFVAGPAYTHENKSISFQLSVTQ